MRRLVVVLALALAGCATGYGANNGFSGGYSEMQVNDRTWQVSASGNGYTSPQEAQRIAMRRAAELTVWMGFHSFYVNNAADDVATTAYTTPVNCNTQGTVSPGYGGSATYQGNTNCYGGQTHMIRKPTSAMTVTMVTATEAAQRPPGYVLYDARLMLRNMGARMTPEGKVVIDNGPAGYPKPVKRYDPPPAEPGTVQQAVDYEQPPRSR